jgi:hypothetical protein
VAFSLFEFLLKNNLDWDKGDSSENDNPSKILPGIKESL